jgi:hypothetical protein
MNRAPFTYHRASTLPAAPARIVDWIEAAGTR